MYNRILSKTTTKGSYIQRPFLLQRFFVFFSTTSTTVRHDPPFLPTPFSRHYATMSSGGKKKLARNDLHWHFPHYRHAPGPNSIIRRDNWKLIKFWEGIYELYDLEKDLGETKNLAESMPDKVRELDAALLKRLKADGAKLPKPNPEYSGK